MPNRIYSEEEVAQLIRRAVELEAERSIARDRQNRAGLTIGDLEHIAAEAGIDPELIQQAANELASGGFGSSQVRTESARVKRDEIVCEQWLQVQPGEHVIDDLITELNHKYGTSDTDISWWDKLWDDYNGKAKTRKSATSREWEYTDEMGYYTTRVLFQRRADKFRIRVSKRQLWDMSWQSDYANFGYLAVALVIFSVIGGSTAFALLNTAWPGVAIGSLLSFSTYPLIKYFTKRSITKHRDEVTETANELAELAMILIKNPDGYHNRQESKEEVKSRLIDIEYLDEQEKEDSPGQEERLRNNLR